MSTCLSDVENAVIGDFVHLEAIQSCEREYEQRLAANSMTVEVKFTYAWHLIKSQYKNDITKGIGLMSELVKHKDQRDFLYYIAVGYYKLEDYIAAADYVDRILDIEANNSQAKLLKSMISKKQFGDEVINPAMSTSPVTKIGPLEKKPSNPLHRSIWKQYTFILNNHTLRYVNELTHQAKELRCASIVQIDSDTDTKDAQFPVTIYFKGSGRKKLYLRAQSKADHTSWLEAFKQIVPWAVPAPFLASRLIPPPPPELQDRPPIPLPVLQDRPPIPPPVPLDRPPIPPPVLQDRPPIPPPEQQDRPPIPPPEQQDRPPTHNSMNSAAISGIEVNGNHDDYMTISNIAVDKPVDVTSIPQATSSFNICAQNAANGKLAEQIYKVFTPEQVLGLTDMLSLLYEQSFQNHHLYVNLEMLLEAITSTKTDNTTLLCTEEYEISRPDWAKASTDDFNICDLVGNDVVAHISPSSITGKQKIGEGQFGEVFIAILQRHESAPPIQVAMKSFKNIHNCKQEANFMKEMAQLSQLVHPNIVKMYGIVLEAGGQFPAMLMEYLPHSDLKTFLSNNPRSTPKLVKYMIDIAMAMNYVSEKGLIHRDLAARNVLVDGDELCKVGDFGLLRELPADSDVYVPQSDGPLPCRWMALESLTNRHFSVASDVWSYGVLMWEMFKPKKLPYEESKPFEIVSKLKDGYRLPLPRGYPSSAGRHNESMLERRPKQETQLFIDMHTINYKSIDA